MSRRSARSEPAKPFTVEHFRQYATCAVLDNGEPFALEPFQEQIAADVFSGVREVWVLIPEGCGKTTLVSLFALYMADYTSTPSIPIAASSREQAEIMYRQAEGFVTRSPELADRFRCYEGYRRIKSLRTAGRIQIYAADDRTGDGIIPAPLAIVDELHRHRNLKLYETWRGKLWKREAQILTISTAGEPGSDFEEARDRIRKQGVSSTLDGAHLRVEGRGLVMHEWAVRDRSKVGDMEVVAEANPLGSLTAEALEAKRSSSTMTDEHWERFTCNIATRIEGQAVSPADWDKLAEPGLEADAVAWKVGGLDLGWKIDTTAMVVLGWEGRERRVVAAVRVLTPPVDEADVVRGLLELQEEFRPEGWVFDPNAGGQQMAQLLEKGDHPLQGGGRLEFIEHAQDNAPMALAAARLDEAVRNGWLVHDGDDDLRRHVLNAVRHDLGGEKWKFDRPKDAKGRRRARYPIDALTALLMAHSVAVAQRDVNTEPLVAWA